MHHPLVLPLALEMLYGAIRSRPRDDSHPPHGEIIHTLVAVKNSGTCTPTVVRLYFEPSTFESHYAHHPLVTLLALVVLHVAKGNDARTIRS